MSAFRVGQKVVCIRANVVFQDGISLKPAVGDVCTVRDIGADVHGISGVWLVEHVNTPVATEEGHRERGFQASDFRPVAYPKQSLEHDVAEFKRIARHTPAPSKESVE